MKHIFFVAVILLLASCGRNNHTHSGENYHSHPHEHSADCDHDHDHEHGDDCDHDHDHSDNSHGSHAGHSHEGDGHTDDPEDIIFTATQAAMTDFVVDRARHAAFRDVIKASGVVSPAQGEQVSIVAPADGIVSLSGNRLTEGANVTGGRTLFTVSSAKISGGDQLAADRSAYLKAKADYERAVRLREDNIVSQAELDALAAEYESARIRYESLTDSGGGSGAAVTAPISGFIYGIEVSEGQFVERGQLLATVVRSRTMELRAEVSQRYYGKLPSVTGANFRVPSSDRVFSISELGGSLISAGGAVQPDSPLVPVVFRFNYTPEIIAGSFAEVSLLGAQREDVITLPITAVTEQQGLYYVYVRTGGDVYRRREVKIGGDDGVNVVILSGIAEGEQVVTRGAVNVRMASASGAIPHGHEH